MVLPPLPIMLSLKNFRRFQYHYEQKEESNEGWITVDLVNTFCGVVLFARVTGILIDEEDRYVVYDVK